MEEIKPITEEELEELKKCNRMKNEEQFEAVVRDIKERRDGEYPRDWFAKVIETGIIKNLRNF